MKGTGWEQSVSHIVERIKKGPDKTPLPDCSKRPTMPALTQSQLERITRK